jgi:hypothetical protein
MIKRLPQFAESHFAVLCAAAGAVCNASMQDECGWDFFVQFPPKPSRMRSADMQAPGPEAFVQIKSTREAPLVARIKLSNALRAAQATQPHFVVLVVPERTGPRTYARHFWEAEISRTLRRVRLAERDGDIKFNKRYFDLRMDEADARDGDLLEWMRGVIEGVKPNYAQAKGKILLSAGHEGGFGSMKMTFTGTSDDFLNLHLGLIESIPVTRVQFVSQRFGIDSAQPELDIEDVQFFVEPVSKLCHLRLQGGSPTRELFVDARFYSAELPGAKPPVHRWRLDAGPLRIVGGNGTFNANITTGYGEAKPLADLELFLTIAAWRGAGPVALCLFVEDKRVPLGTMTLPTQEDDPEWNEVKVWGEGLRGVVAAARSEDPVLTLLDLYDARILLSRFATFVATPSIRIEYEPEGTDDPARAAIYYLGCDVGEWCFLAVIERNTRSDLMEGVRRSLTFGAPRILDAIVRRGTWRDHRGEIEATYRDQVERLGNPETLWELGEIEEFFADKLRSTA